MHGGIRRAEVSRGEGIYQTRGGIRRAERYPAGEVSREGGIRRTEVSRGGGIRRAER